VFIFARKFNNINIHYTTTDKFFETFTGTIDMAFIDADHYLESVQKVFDNVLKRLNQSGIMLHDTDPEEDRLINPGYCGDSYKIVPIYYRIFIFL
jgi:hypothetical protein